MADDKFFGIPVGKEANLDALIQDFWNPTTDEIFTQKKFLGLGWGVNFCAIGKKIGLIR